MEFSCVHTSAHQFFPLGVLFGCLVCRELRKIWSREKEEFSKKRWMKMAAAVPWDSHFAVVFGELKFEKLGLGKQTHIHKHILRELESRRVGVDDEQLCV